MSSEILEYVTSALQAGGSAAKPLSPSDAAIIVKTAREKFVRGDPRAWWMSFKGEPKLYNSGENDLENLLPVPGRNYWFIPETEESDLKVFDLTIAQIKHVIKDCPFFEYYVVDKQYRWIISESDHNQFHVLKEE